MSFIALIFTGFALSMDAFAVSITKGMTIKNLKKSTAVKMALAFGIFQGGMPLLGWALGISFESYIKSIDHWIAFILLGFIGFNMIKGFFDDRKEKDASSLEFSSTTDIDDLSNKEIIMLAVATSIDALAVGISFAFLNVNIILAASIICIITFLVCVVGVFVGNKVGDIFNGYAELVGGIILILIVTVIAINTILADDDKKETSKDSNTVNNTTVAETTQVTNNSLEERLEGILAKINGVGKVDVLINYSESTEVVAMYNENIKETSTEEQDESGGTRVITENDIQRDVIFQEDNGEKTPITQKTIMPKIEGTIITAEGAGDANVKENIIQAVSAATGLASHKIQVFQMSK